MVLLSQCTEGCGWVAALLASLSWGSFGVPIKGETASSVNVDPLVMQSYKTIMCFVTCWLVIPLGEPFGFTPWGIVSGIFWVPGAAAGIYGIRQAGLAISVGTWSSLVVVSSFIWGIGVFRENVKSVHGAFAAMLLLCCGLGGMARYSHPPPSKDKSAVRDGMTVDAEEEMVPLKGEDIDTFSPSGGEDKLDPIAAGRGVAKRKVAAAAAPQSTDAKPILADTGGGGESDIQQKTTATTTTLAPLEVERSQSFSDYTTATNRDMSDAVAIDRDSIILFKGRMVLTRRQMGILGAVFNGTWGGTNLIPLHYAKAEGYGGAAYVISFACGSMLVLVVMWFLRYLYNLYRFDGSHREAYGALPSFHLRQMWLPGMLSGTLYSIGNFSGIIATTYLGQGVGYSVCQSALIVSGMWGICYFKEITGADAICKWFCCAFVTLTGILWLSYEHKGDAVH
mmetsp:Transcript_8786/g.18872  ORF Transcript_8786/g.18872 Transcript_8786/m.18872 type:complete len:452 (+) Transcript_8786:147-1502(+)